MWHFTSMPVIVGMINAVLNKILGCPSQYGIQKNWILRNCSSSYEVSITVTESITEKR